MRGVGRRAMLERLGRRGTIAIVSALSGTFLIGFVALAVDVGVWEMNAVGLQGAADNAALSAGAVNAKALSNNADAKTAAALATAEANSVVAAHGLGASTTVVNIPPKTGNYTATTNAVEVLVSQQQRNYFSSVLSEYGPVAAPKPTGRGVAIPSSQSGMCIMALATSGPSVTASNGLVTADCDMYVNSTAPCDVDLTGTGRISVHYARLSGTGCPATASYTTYFTASGGIESNKPATPDPYAGQVIPTPSTQCLTHTGKFNTLTHAPPGTYAWIYAPAGSNVVLDQNATGGLFIFNGACNVAGQPAGSLTIEAGALVSNVGNVPGSGGTLVFTNSVPGNSFGGLIMHGSYDAGSDTLTKAQIDLAPTTDGISSYTAMSVWYDGRSQVAFAPDLYSELIIGGVFYAPGSDVTWYGNLSPANNCGQLIAKTIHFTMGQNADGTSTTTAFRHPAAVCANIRGMRDVPGGGAAAAYVLKE